MSAAKIFSKNLEESIALKQAILTDEKLQQVVLKWYEESLNCYRKGGKLLFCGNGGSAADAQHLAAEFTGRYYYDRPPLNAEALHVNASYMTAVANDYDYQQVYARMIKGIANSRDILVAMSTSGNSGNIIAAVKQAKKQGVFTVGMTGEGGGQLAQICDLCIQIPSKNTPRIQEAHMLLGHGLCEYVEAQMFPQS